MNLHRGGFQSGSIPERFLEVPVKLLYYPDPKLKQKSVDVVVGDESIRELAAKMLEVMYAKFGVGLAAPQVGVFKRLLVMDTGEVNGNPTSFVMVNPKIVRVDGKQKGAEGCLSVPGAVFQVERAAEVHVEFLNLNFELCKVRAVGLTARVILHEIDHLDGVVFTERVSRLNRDVTLKRYHPPQPR